MPAVETTLLADFRNRDRAALVQIVSSHHEFLIRLVTPLVTRDFAEDVVQDAWIKAFAAAERFAGRASLRTWLGQIALNTARSWRRAHLREASFEQWGEDPGSPVADRFADDGHWSIPPEPWHDDTPDALLAEDELRVCLEECLVQLPPNQQIVIRLRDIERMPLPILRPSPRWSRHGRRFACSQRKT